MVIDGLPKGGYGGGSWHEVVNCTSTRVHFFPQSTLKRPSFVECMFVLLRKTKLRRGEKDRLRLVIQSLST